MSNTFLTIDTDWAVSPTPQPLDIHSGEKPSKTLECDIYNFHKSGRPAESRHTCLSANETAAWLRQNGLPSVQGVQITDLHSQALDVLPKGIDHLVYLDAHLDIYSVMTVGLKAPRPEVHLTIRDLYRGQVAKRLPGQSPAFVKAIEDGLRDGAWLLILALSTPNAKPLRVTWVAPWHFDAALASGFPYAEAQWHTTLTVGRGRNVWRFELNAARREIKLRASDPSLMFRPIDIQILTKGDRIDWGDLHPTAHICRTPYLTPPSMDGWAEKIAALLQENRTSQRR